MDARIARLRPVHPAWLLALQAAALWPIWLWYAKRTADGSDEPWGLLALGAVLLCAYASGATCAKKLGPVLLASCRWPDPTRSFRHSLGTGAVARGPRG